MKKAFLRNGASVGRLVNKARSVGSSGGIAESNNRSSRTTRIQSTRSSEGEGDKSYLCKWGGRERVNDSLETGGARNRTTKGARSSRFVVQMTLPIRMLRHPLLALTPRLGTHPLEAERGPKGVKGGCSAVWNRRQSSAIVI